jgi:hypothetical protein
MKRKLAENLKRIEDRIRSACARAHRERESVTLVAVTKTLTIDVIRTMVDMGFTDLGESRVQELTRRAAAIDEWLGRRARDVAAGAKPRPRWHMIGHLQRNKIKTLLPWVDTIHSVDSLRLAEELDAHAKKMDRVLPAFIEVNVAEEPNKHGVRVPAAFHLVDVIAGLTNLQVIGLMGMAPLTDDTDRIRRVFTRLRELYDDVIAERVAGDRFRCLSMGMSNDFEIGIELGATHVRIGSALFAGIKLAPQAVPAD